MEILKLHSPDFTQENIAKLAELFPNCVTEIKDEGGRLKDEKGGGNSSFNLHPSSLRYAIDFDQLRQELATAIVEGPQERYQLNWPGKREALLTANAPIAKTLRPCREESVDFDTTQNLFIEGDNLDALKLLQETYLNKVKMIYIDPPYNTGNDFIYEDDFAEDSEAYFRRSNQKDEAGNRLVANTEANGRFHSDWLTMMYSRLKLAKNLLMPDGAIFVSCDEMEQARLRNIMDEVFGMGNFVADMVWAAGRKNDSRLISVSHEYIVCYTRDAEYLKEKKTLWRQRKKGLGEIYAQHEKLKREYRNDYSAMTVALKAWYRDLADSHPAKAHKHYNNIDERGVFFPADISSISGASRPRYEIPHPVTGEPVVVPARGWGYTLESLNRLIEEGRVNFGPDHTTVPTLKAYLKESEYQTPYSVFYQDGRAASKRLRALMGGDYFDFPKDEQIIQELVGMLTSPEDTVLDLFAGSGTTAHAVMALNAEDGGKRRHIMVQLPEPCDEKSEAFKAGYKTIAEIGKERIRRAGKKIREELKAKVEGGRMKDEKNQKLLLDASDSSFIPQPSSLDIGFRVLKVDSSNMKEVYYTPDAVQQADLLGQVDNIRADRTPEDLLFQVLLDWGVDLALPITQEAIAGKAVFFVDGNALAACFERGIDEAFVKELAARKPLRVVFRDAGFSSDSVKINIEQIFRLVSPGTEVKAI